MQKCGRSTTDAYRDRDAHRRPAPPTPPDERITYSAVPVSLTLQNKPVLQALEGIKIFMKA